MQIPFGEQALKFRLGSQSHAFSKCVAAGSMLRPKFGEASVQVGLIFLEPAQEPFHSANLLFHANYGGAYEGSRLHT
jgi:hypothetical protein